VLSACYTGAGKIRNGEGIRSLARAFHYAGSPGVVATLWSANDKINKTIIVEFYENLIEELPKDVALQKAKLFFLNEGIASGFYYKNMHPSYWSTLVIIGESCPIDCDL